MENQKMDEQKFLPPGLTPEIIRQMERKATINMRVEAFFFGFCAAGALLCLGNLISGQSEYPVVWAVLFGLNAWCVGRSWESVKKTRVVFAHKDGTPLLPPPPRNDV